MGERLNAMRGKGAGKNSPVKIEKIEMLNSIIRVLT